MRNARFIFLELKHNYDKACAMSDENAKEVKDLIDQLGKKEAEIEKHRHQIQLQNESIAELKENNKYVWKIDYEYEFWYELRVTNH